MSTHSQRFLHLIPVNPITTSLSAKRRVPTVGTEFDCDISRSILLKHVKRAVVKVGSGGLDRGLRTEYGGHREPDRPNTRSQPKRGRSHIDFIGCQSRRVPKNGPRQETPVRFPGAGRRSHGAKSAVKTDWPEEFLNMILAAKVVPDMDEAPDHIDRYGSKHTEAIVIRDYDHAERFLSEVDSSAVLVKASTRFNDGNQLELGAEIGINTSKLHAFGPMGLEELTATKLIVYGQGQIRK